MNALKVFKDNFINPGTEFRSVPFWAWNDKLCCEELARQVRDMKENGMGGFFIHSRDGLETEYLGSEWMDCVKQTVKTAKETGLNVWIYDEDRWPSGAAGGAVPSEGGDSFRAKALTIEVTSADFSLDGSEIALFKAVIAGYAILECMRLDTKTVHLLKDNEVFLIFRREVSGASEWFNGDAPADNLNPESVKAFINNAYEPYKNEIGEEFGKTIAGFFTDEPNIADSNGVYTGNRGWIPWTDGFIEYFKQLMGYNIAEFLPYIFLKGEKSSKSRHDYWRCISSRFCMAYTEEISDWCEKNGVKLTGHYLFENDLGAAVRLNGSIMPHYLHHHIPGIDLLREQAYEVLTVKQCTSVANQFGKKRVLTETYGCTGWDFTFEGQKWVGDWQYALGVNFRCQHLALYSLKGCRKRDFPPSFNYNTSWWKYNHVVEDYFARLSYALSSGDAIRDVLVIHPGSTAWSMLGASYDKNKWWEDPQIIEVNEYGEKFNYFLKVLLASHYDNDLGDETIMEEYGRVEDGKLYIKLAGYSIVVLPPIKTLFASTIRLLTEFMDAGGNVIASAPRFTMVEGEVSETSTKLFSHKNLHMAQGEEEVLNLLEKLTPRDVSIRCRNTVEAPEFLYILKDQGDFRVLYIVNTDCNNSHDVRITLNSSGSVEEWDLLTGHTVEQTVDISECKINFIASFGPCGSKLYIIDKRCNPKIGKTEFNFKHPRETEEILVGLGPDCEFSRTGPNALILDRCSFRIAGKDWSEEADVWQAQRELRDCLGMRQIYHNGLPQRYKWVDLPHPNDGRMVEFKFRFIVEVVPATETFLALEESENFRIILNGRNVDNNPQGWYLDRSFDRIRLPGFKKGINELVLTCEYSSKMEFEDIYITGDFGVDTGRNIVREPECLHFGDWGMQGYIHYCGSMIYHFEFDYSGCVDGNAVLSLGDYKAVTVEVRINDKAVVYIPWRSANRPDITGFLKKGRNTIDIEVMGSPRNLFGPFHNSREKVSWSGWEAFRSEGVEYCPGYTVKPYGLFGQINIFKLKNKNQGAVG